MSHFTKFVSFVKQESLSRADRFLVEITGPSGANIDKFITHEHVSFMCDYVSHPAYSIQTTDASLYGAAEMRPSGAMDYHNVLGMSFVLDQSQKVKTYFTNWMGLIVNDTTFYVSYKKDYTASVIKIHQLDMDDKVTYTTELYDVFPIEIGSVDASTQASNQFSRLTVQFNFKTWRGYPVNPKATR